MNDIRHIVLDVGRVLIHYDPHLAFRELIPDDAARAAFAATRWFPKSARCSAAIFAARSPGSSSSAASSASTSSCGRRATAAISG